MLFIPAQRLESTLKGSGEAKFSRIKAAKQKAIQEHPERLVLDFGIGEPQDPPDPRIVEALRAAVLRPDIHGYADLGGLPFLKSVSRYMEGRFEVKLDPEKEVLPSLGVKSALALLALALVGPGDVVLVTTPGYPVFGVQAHYCGASVYELPLRRENAFLPDLSEVPAAFLNKTKVLVLNYPNSPTGAMAPDSFWHEAIAFCQKGNIALIHDAVYSELDWGAQKVRSIFEFPGAMDCAIELYSFSKAYNMTGWRLGWVCGNRDLLRLYGHAKDNTDSGQFLAIQEAGICALSHPDIPARMRGLYSQRLERLAAILRGQGLALCAPKAGFFLYTQVPKMAQKGQKCWTFSSAESFSQWLIGELGVVTVPWDDVEAHVRWSLTFSEKMPVLETLAQRMVGVRFS